MHDDDDDDDVDDDVVVGANRSSAVRDHAALNLPANVVLANRFHANRFAGDINAMYVIIIIVIIIVIITVTIIIADGRIRT